MEGKSTPKSLKREKKKKSKLETSGANHVPSKSSTTKNPAAPSELSTEVNFISLQSLRATTQEKLSVIRSITIAMLPVVAAQRGYVQGQFVTLNGKSNSVPALLVFDKGLKNTSIIKEDIPFDGLSEKEAITVTPCMKIISKEISLYPLSNREMCDSIAFRNYLKEQLVINNYIVCIGINIIVSYLTQQVVLKVTNMKPFGMKDGAPSHIPFQCVWQTEVTIEAPADTDSKRTSKQEISFDDIGGYQKELQFLQSEIDKFFSCGTSKLSKGILISGPSGCGKSLIGSALRTRYNGSFLNIDIDDVKSKYQGEAQQNLKRVFVKASNRAPCVIFIDDLDMLCSSRDAGGNTGVVTALLHLMDGVSSSSSEGVLVIATASKAQTLDSALRRPGRLSVDIILSPPDEAARLDILQKMLNRRAHDLQENDFKKIACDTPGYVGGDLRVVLVEAITQVGDEKLTRLDIEDALATIKPAALRDSATCEQKINLSDIYGYEDLKTSLRESLKLTLTHSPVFEKCGISPPSRFLLFGPPGCGKSYIIMGLAAEFHMSVISVKRSTVLGKYFGESEQNLARIFSQAHSSAPCILLFENFDGLAGRRSAGDGGGKDVEGRIINHLKVQLDGIVRNENIFIFAESNRPDLIDKDILRPGRFHEYHLVNLPGPEDRHQSFAASLSFPFCLSEDLSLDTLVSCTESFTTSEILQLCNELKQHCRTTALPFSEVENIVITKEMVEEVLESVVPNTSRKMLKKYQTFAEIYCSRKEG